MPTQTNKDSEDEVKSGLIPKSMFDTEPSVGDTITLKIESIFSDEVEVSVVETEDETDKSPMNSATMELEDMAGKEMGME